MWRRTGGCMGGAQQQRRGSGRCEWLAAVPDPGRCGQPGGVRRLPAGGALVLVGGYYWGAIGVGV